MPINWVFRSHQTVQVWILSKSLCTAVKWRWRELFLFLSLNTWLKSSTWPRSGNALSSPLKTAQIIQKFTSTLLKMALSSTGTFKKRLYFNNEHFMWFEEYFKIQTICAFNQNSNLLFFRNEFSTILSTRKYSSSTYFEKAYFERFQLLWL